MNLVELQEEEMEPESVLQMHLPPALLPCSEVGGFMATIMDKIDGFGSKNEIRFSNMIRPADSVAKEVMHGLTVMSIGLGD